MKHTPPPPLAKTTFDLVDQIVTSQDSLCNLDDQVNTTTPHSRSPLPKILCMTQSILNTQESCSSPTLKKENLKHGDQLKT